MMRVALGHHVFGIGLSAALRAACGGSQRPISVLSAMPQRRWKPMPLDAAETMNGC